MDQLKLGSIMTDWSSAAYGLPMFPMNTPNGWIVNFYSQVPTAEQLWNYKLRPDHRSKFLCGSNERDLGDEDVQAEAGLISEQIAMVSSVFEAPWILISGGSQMHAPGNPFGNRVWIEAVWKALSRSIQRKVTGFFTHYYPEVDPQAIRSLTVGRHIERHLRNYLDWKPGYKVWLTEIGLSKDFVEREPRLALGYPLTIQRACTRQRCGRWFWYILKQRDSAAGLFDEQGLISPMGRAFAEVPAVVR